MIGRGVPRTPLELGRGRWRAAVGKQSRNSRYGTCARMPSSLVVLRRAACNRTHDVDAGIVKDMEELELGPKAGSRVEDISAPFRRSGALVCCCISRS